MSFFEHLEELRRTLIFVLVVAGVAACAAWFIAEPVLDALVPPQLGKVYFSSPSEGFMVRLKVSAVIGLLVALPIVIARVWGFVAPGLFGHERRAVVPVLVSGSLLFYGGVAFGYVFVIPKTVQFFLSFSGDRLSPLLNVTQYFMFVAKFSLAFGLAFQMPLVLVLLAALGVVSPQRLWRQWRYGIIVIAVPGSLAHPAGRGLPAPHGSTAGPPLLRVAGDRLFRGATATAPQPLLRTGTGRPPRAPRVDGRPHRWPQSAHPVVGHGAGLDREARGSLRLRALSGSPGVAACRPHPRALPPEPHAVRCIRRASGPATRQI